MEATKKKKVNKIVNIVLWVFMAIAFLATITAFLANTSGKGYPVIGDTCYVCIKTDSMDGEGGFKAGTLIVSKVLNSDEDKQSLEVGQIITFYQKINGKDDLNTHKIISKQGSGEATVYVTQGVNKKNIENNVTENVNYEDVQAVWSGKKVPAVGAVINFLQSSVGFLCCIVLPIAGIFVYQVVSFVGVVRDYKNRDKRLISAEDEEEIKKRAIEEFLAKQKQKDEE